MRAHQIQLAETVTQQLGYHKPMLLERLQQRAQRIHHPKLDEILAATPDDLILSLNESQGLSKLTYRVGLKDQSYILSVEIPPEPGHYQFRASPENRFGFRRHLRKEGIPVPGKIGAPFHLPGMPYRCELTDFCPGYIMPRGSDVGPKELVAVGELLGRIHMAAYRPKGLHTPVHRNMEILKHPFLPQGYVHGDTGSGNVIFRAEDQTVAGLIDFESAKKRPLVFDLAYSIGFFATTAHVVDGAVQLSYSPEKAATMIAAYETVRPLTMAEEKVLPEQIAIAVKKHQRYWATQPPEAVPGTTPVYGQFTAAYRTGSPTGTQSATR